MRPISGGHPGHLPQARACSPGVPLATGMAPDLLDDVLERGAAPTAPEPPSLSQLV